MRAKFSLVVLLLAALVVSGCAIMQPRFSIRVNSISRGVVDKNSYILLPGNKDTNAADLQFKEYAAYVNRALIKQGFMPAESLEKANVAIFLVYGIGGPKEHLSTTHTGTYTTYFRFMVLDAFDLEEYKKSRKEVQLWKTTVTSSGSSGDLRRVFPILVAASQQYIGKNTGQKVEVGLYEEDERVIGIKGITKVEKKVQ